MYAMKRARETGWAPRRTNSLHFQINDSCDITTAEARHLYDIEKLLFIQIWKEKTD